MSARQILPCDENVGQTPVEADGFHSRGAARVCAPTDLPLRAGPPHHQEIPRTHHGDSGGAQGCEGAGWVEGAGEEDLMHDLLY